MDALPTSGVWQSYGRLAAWCGRERWTKTTVIVITRYGYYFTNSN